MTFRSFDQPLKEEVCDYIQGLLDCFRLASDNLAGTFNRSCSDFFRKTCPT